MWLRTSLVTLLFVAAAAGADPVGRHHVRVFEGALAPPPDRARTRTSLLYFGHMTDLHVVDEMSPLRLELTDPAPVGDYAYEYAWRPQEAFSSQALDDAVHAMNARASSAVPQGDAKLASMQFALVTGDLIDNLQHNEMELAVGVLAGDAVDPFSGEPVAPGLPCVGASENDLAELRELVAARAYSGVQRHVLYPPGTPRDRPAPFYDPSRPAQSWLPAFPRYGFPQAPGLLDRAQHRFDARGLSVPFFVARGNHDSFVQGYFPPYLLESLYQPKKRHLEVTGCRKVFPNLSLDPSVAPFAPGELTGARALEVVKKLQEVYEKTTLPDQRVFRFVPPDASRLHIEAPDFAASFSDVPQRAGYDYVSQEERRASGGYAHYYAWEPQPGLRFFSLDTNHVGSGPGGSVSNPQFTWLARELAATPTSTLVVVFAHHTLETIDNNALPASCPPDFPGCHGDPRGWAPAHLGCPCVAEGCAGGAVDCSLAHPQPGEAENVRDLLLRHPNVILYVNGHTHANGIDPFVTGPDGTGFWQVTTASIVEWPQQARTLELMDNGDGTLSVFATLVGPSDDARVPPVDTLPAGYGHAEVVGVGRVLADGDVQWRAGPGRAALGRFVDGKNIDGNVELILRDPRPPRN